MESALIGKWCTDIEKFQMVGEVVGMLSWELYLVKVYRCPGEVESHLFIKHISEMAKYVFNDTQEELKQTIKCFNKVVGEFHVEQKNHG